MTRKRLIFIVITAAVLLLAAVLILIRLQPTPPRVEASIATLTGPTPAALTARLNEIQGIVTARQAGQAQFVPVTPGLVLNVSSAVKTGEQSKVRLDLSNQSIVRLGENTLFVFQGEVKASDGYHYLINLGIGELWIILRDGQLEVQTPSGLAAVRGSFLHVVYYPEDQSTQITCLEGNCNLKNAGGKVDLVAGQTAIVYNVDVPPVTGRMNNHDVTQWLVNNPEATLVIPQLQVTSAALPVETPGPSGTPPSTQEPTALAIFEATLAATYETPMLVTLQPSGTPAQTTPSPAPSPAVTLVPTLLESGTHQPSASPQATLPFSQKLSSTAQPSATAQRTYWIPPAATATSQPPAPSSTPTPTALSTPTPTSYLAPNLTLTSYANILFEHTRTMQAIIYAQTSIARTQAQSNTQTSAAKTSQVSFVGCGSVTEIPTTECDVLVALYNNTTGSTWTHNTGWLVTNTPCSWYGVTCSGGHVTELTFQSNFIRGPFPAELGSLSRLQKLDLTENRLTGSIPPELGSLSQLQTLNLNSNYLSGGIPPEIWNLSQLIQLSLAHNSLSGTISPQIANLTQLKYIELEENSFSGSIPPQIGSLTQLLSVYLFHNGLSGTIPPELGSLTNLVYLFLDNNSLSGSIPLELGNLTQLKGLRLNDNQLSGSIPSEMGNFPQMQGLLLSNNLLSGSLPPELGNLTQLVGLEVDNNALSGNIPTQIGNLTALGALYLNNNQLSGTVPTELGNLTHLQELYLQTNQLSGPLPSSLTNLTGLTHIRMGGGSNTLDLLTTDSSVRSFLDSKDASWTSP